MNRKQRRAAEKQSKQTSLNHTGVNSTDLFTQGVAYHQQGKLDEAAALYRQLLSKHPQHAEGWYHLGGVAYQKGQWQETIEHIQKALELQPDYAEAHNVLGVALKNLDRLQDAHHHLNRAITLQSNFPDAQCNFGNVLMKLERLEEAEKHYRQAIALKPDFVLAHSNLGATLLKSRRWDEAIDSFKKAIALAPTYAEAHNNLGVAFKEQGQTEQAIEHYKKALALNPQYADAHNNLGNAFVALERPEDALEHFHSAITLGLKTAETLSNLGAALQDLERFDEALECYQQAITLNPEYAAAYNNMGNTYNLQGKPEEAIALYRQALDRTPDYAEAYENIGVVCSEQGRIEEALESFQKSIAANPNYTKAYRNISSLHKYAPDDAHATALLSKARDLHTLPDEAQIHLNYALGKYYQDIDDYDQAFTHFDTGASLKRKMLNYDPTMIEKALKGVAQFFEPGNWSSTLDYGCSSELPIFIVGMPRSGTTLIEQILAAHPDVHGAGELKEFDKALNGFKANQNLWTATSSEATNLAQRGQHYVDALQNLDPDAKRITDKMPFNFLNIGLIHLALPQAKIIHCQRNPIDTCLSNFLTYFIEAIHWSYDLTETGRFYVAYAQIMEHWQKTLPGRILDVQYEDVVADLDGQVRRIVEHCGLPWDDACLNFQNTKRTVRTASAGQVRKPIYASSVQRWRRYETHLSPLLDALKPVLDKQNTA